MNRGSIRTAVYQRRTLLQEASAWRCPEHLIPKFIGRKGQHLRALEAGRAKITLVDGQICAAGLQKKRSMVVGYRNLSDASAGFCAGLCVLTKASSIGAPAVVFLSRKFQGHIPPPALPACVKAPPPSVTRLKDAVEGLVTLVSFFDLQQLVLRIRSLASCMRQVQNEEPQARPWRRKHTKTKGVGIASSCIRPRPLKCR